jgi:plasmid stabilization system protein ParE
MNLVWSEQARNSLAKIYDYIYQDSPRSAEKVLKTLLKKSESL